MFAEKLTQLGHIGSIARDKAEALAEQSETVTPQHLRDYIARQAAANIGVQRTGLGIADLVADKVSIPAVHAVWTDVLVPELQRRELERAAKKAAFLKVAIPAGFASIVIALIGLRFLGAFALLLAGAVFLLIAGKKLADMRTVGKGAKALLVHAACSVFGYTFHDKAVASHVSSNWLEIAGDGKAVMAKLKSQFIQPTATEDLLNLCPTPALEACTRLGLFTGYNRAKFDDMISGERAGAKFTMVEANLERETGSGKSHSVKQIFHGALLHVEYPDRFLGTTVIARKGQGRKIARKTGLERIDIVSKEFEDSFDVCSNDQAEARYLLTPDKLLRLIALEQHFQNGRICAIFDGGHMTIAMTCKDLFEVGSAWNALVDETRFATCIDELCHINDLIDGYMTRDWAIGRV